MSTLSRRLQKLEAAALPSDAVYVVRTPEERRRVALAFLPDYARLVDDAAARHADTSEPVEERYTYEEAVRAGLVRETVPLPPPDYSEDYARLAQ